MQGLLAVAATLDAEVLSHSLPQRRGYPHYPKVQWTQAIAVCAVLYRRQRRDGEERCGAAGLVAKAKGALRLVSIKYLSKSRT